MYENLICTDLAPNDFYLFPKLKGILGGSRIGSSSKLKDTNGEWLNSFKATEFAEGIENLVKGYHKRLNLIGDYDEK